MKKQRILQLLLILGSTVFWQGNSAQALSVITSAPPSGSGWTEHNETTPCTYTYYTIDTSTHRDFTLAEKVIDLGIFEGLYGDHVDVPIPSVTSTWTFNCHGYIFIGSGGWLNSPSPFENVTHEENPGGTVYRFAGHSSYVGYDATYVYFGKCGQGPFSNHDNEQPYGAHNERWCPIP